ncbi:MAG: hypothetical protein ACLFPQ_02390 [Candidatus Woesearchaeota archaeon]
MAGKDTQKKTIESNDKLAERLFSSENKIIVTVVLVSIVVFSVFIIVLDASITGMVVEHVENSKMDNLFFIITVFGLVIFLGSMFFYYLSTKDEVIK